MMKLLVSVFTFFAIALPLQAEGKEDKLAPLVQTKGGIKVSIEKIARERILNPAGWLRRHGVTDNVTLRNGVKTQWQPEYTLTVFATVEAPDGDVRSIGGVIVRLADKDVKTVYRKLATYSPPIWPDHLQTVHASPDASGLIWTSVLDQNYLAEEIYPISVKLQVTDKNDRKHTFLFEDIEW